MKYIRKNIPYILTVILGILIASVVYSASSVLFSAKKSVLRVDPQMLVSQYKTPPLPTASPSASPSATPSPSPTPETFSGFCLNVPVLFYHHVQPQADAVAKKETSVSVDVPFFDQQMAYVVSHGYTAIYANELIVALSSHTKLPGKSIVITFDDGYKDNHDFALPILKKYNLKANLMISSGLIESGTDFLSWGDINDMKNSGLFYFTDHTWSHYAINHGTTEKIQYEIQTAQKQIQDHTGQTINVFTYPYGSTSSQAVSLLQQDGFIGAFTTNPGTTQCDSFIMALRRTRIGNASLTAYGL